MVLAPRPSNSASASGETTTKNNTHCRSGDQGSPKQQKPSPYGDRKTRKAIKHKKKQWERKTVMVSSKSAPMINTCTAAAYTLRLSPPHHPHSPRSPKAPSLTPPLQAPISFKKFGVGLRAPGRANRKYFFG